MKARNVYWTDLSQVQWQRLRGLLPRPGRGAPRRHSERALLNALFYQLRTGCSWRLLPANFPPWGAVWQQFRRWRDNGTLDKVHAALRAEVRQRAGRAPEPSAAVLDSQSVRTTEKGGRKALTPPRR